MMFLKKAANISKPAAGKTHWWMMAGHEKKYYYYYYYYYCQ
jgi:hypothetical protein